MLAIYSPTGSEHQRTGEKRVNQTGWTRAALGGDTDEKHQSFHGFRPGPGECGERRLELPVRLSGDFMCTTYLGSRLCLCPVNCLLNRWFFLPFDCGCAPPPALLLMVFAPFQSTRPTLTLLHRCWAASSAPGDLGLGLLLAAAVGLEDWRHDGSQTN